MRNGPNYITWIVLTLFVVMVAGIPVLAEEIDGIILNGFDRDIWVHQTTIGGQFNTETVENIRVLVDGTEFESVISGDRFTADVFLNSGENSIIAVGDRVDGTEVQSEPLVFDLKLSDRPRAQIIVGEEGGRIVLDASSSSESIVSGASLVDYSWQERSGNPSSLGLESVSGEYVTLATPVVDGEYYVQVFVTDALGNTDRAETYFVVENQTLRLIDFATDNPAWIEEAIVYGVMPNNLGMFGFQTVIDELEFLSKLGVNTLWLSPVQDSLTLGHGYDLIDYFTVRANYGTEEEFRQLVEEAHALGMRVLMDVVPNHTAFEHRYFQDSLDYFEESPYYDYYQRNFLGYHVYYFDWVDLPNLNFDNPEVVNWMTEGMAYWVREYGIDGFRVDVAWGIRQRNPEFWPTMRAELQRIKADVLLIAEASARDDYYFTEGFDAAYDWTDQLGRWAWEHVFEQEGEIPERLHNALTNDNKGYHQDALVFRFLNNNDTDYRFITRYGPELTRTAAALLLTLPGIPQIYTGQEVGGEFRPYYDNWPVPRADVHNMYDYYAKLIELRLDYPSLRSRDFLAVESDASDAVYAYLRYSASNEPILVVLNFSGQSLEVELDLPRDFQASFSRETRDLLADQELHSGLRVSLEPWQARILLGN